MITPYALKLHWQTIEEEVYQGCNMLKCCTQQVGAFCAADLRASNVMELKNKKSLAADSTNETALSGNDVAGREAALSFSGEDMTKAAAKRHALPC